jgi:hypothetical protein
MATTSADVAARIAALQNLQPYTGPKISWPKLWGDLPVMGQTPEGYAVARQPGGTIVLADPNKMIGTTNDLLGMSSYISSGGEAGWWGAGDGSSRGHAAIDMERRNRALDPYIVGVDGSGQVIYDFGDGNLMNAEGAKPFNVDNGGSIAPVAPLSAHTDGNMMGSQFDAAKMREAGYELMSFGPGGMKPYDPVSDFYAIRTGDESVGWVKNIGGTLFDPYGKVLNPANSPTAGSGGAWGQIAPEGNAYAGTRPPVVPEELWASRGYNLNAASAWSYQPQQQAQVSSGTPAPNLPAAPPSPVGAFPTVEVRGLPLGVTYSASILITLSTGEQIRVAL